MNIQEISEIVSEFGTVIIASVAIWVTYKLDRRSRELENDRMMKDLFSECNQRYDKLNDYILLILSLSDEEMENFNNKKNDELIRGTKKEILIYKINDYFNLCAEEFYWYSKGRIDHDIWGSWSIGMNKIYNESKIVRDLWKNECLDGNYKSYYINRPNAFFLNALAE